MAKENIGFLPSFQKDIALFKDTLAAAGKAGMLVVDRVQNGVDNRFRRYYYKEEGFSIIPILTGGMTDSEYHHLVDAINKLKGTVSDETFEEVLFAIKSRVESDYQKGPVYVDYEDNRRLKGREYRPFLYRAIIEKQVLRIHYKTFNGDELEYVFHPYLLKQYNERWFAFGYSKEYGPYTSIPLDRLEERPVPIGTFTEERPDDYMKYFKKRVGVSNNGIENCVRHIILSIHDKDTWGRVVTKPIHLSQEIVSVFNQMEQSGRISLDVIPNLELLTRVLSLGANVSIEETRDAHDFRAFFIQTIKKISGRYPEIH